MNKIKIAGIPFKLAGDIVAIGTKLDFKALDKDGKPWSLASIKGPKIISVFPDISTRVCDLQTHEVAKLSSKYPHATFISISMDPVDVIKQWCAANSLSNLTIVSDAQHHEFADQTHLLITKTHKLARCAIFLNEKNEIVEISLNEELKQLPDFARVEVWAQQISHH